MELRKYIRILSDEDRDSFIAFVKSWFHDKYILTDKKFVNWQYTTPFSKISSPNVLIVSIKEKVMGFLGIIPLSLNYFGKDVYGVCFANWQMDKALHSKGFGALMLSVSLENIQIAYNTSHSKILELLFRKSGWQTGMLVRRFIKVFDAEKVTDMLSEKGTVFEETKEESVDDTFTFMECHSFGKDTDRFWERVCGKYKIAVNRTSTYLNWRYTNHPVFDYKLFIVRKNKEIEAFAVVRLEKSGTYTIGRIVDFAATDDAEVFTLSALCRWFRRQYTDLADFFFTGSFHESALERAGFKETNTEPYASIPYLFNPIDHKRSSTNFTFRVVDKTLQRLGTATYKNFYITKGDCDQDRPNP